MKNKILIWGCVLVALVFTSCGEDFLDRPVRDSITTENFYQTEEDAQQALVAVYDALGFQSSPGVSWSPFLTVSDVLSDDAIAGGADANDGFLQNQMDKFSAQPENVILNSIWLRNYTGIYRANVFLEKIGDIDASEEFKTRTIAEAKFLRAYFHLELVRFFENIPLMTFTVTAPSEYDQPQAEPSAVYNQIAKDLVEAIEDLPETISASEQGRISKWAAEGLLARAYLFYNGVYGDDMNVDGTSINRSVVLNYLEDLINNGGFSLLDNYNDNFRKTSEFSSESVFEISYNDSPVWWDWGFARGAEGNLAAQMQGPRVTDSNNWSRGWSFAPVSFELYSALENDPRLSTTIVTQDELDGTLIKGYQHTGYYSRKYTSDAEHRGSGGQFEMNRTVNYRVIRFSDVLLMAAELGSPSAQTYLDMVRERVGLPSIPATTENIFNERRLELALEGIRYFDVIRRGVSTATAELSSNGVRGPFYEGQQQLFDTQFNSNTRGFLPIPQVQIDLSAGTFQQNAGY